MTDATKYQFTTPSVPKAYEEFLVPRLFEPWARLLLDEVNLQPGEAVLDVATGPGTVARLAAARLGSRGRVVATDIALPMLDIARAKPVAAGAAQIEYVDSPAAPLAAANGTFDAVLCQQGLQFFPDRPAALREMHRVLKPNGRAAIAVWTQIERNQIFAAYHAALRATVNAELADLILGPFSWPSGAALRKAAEEAGFREVRLLTRRCRWCWREAWTRQLARSLPHLCRRGLPRFPRRCRKLSSPGCGARWPRWKAMARLLAK